MYKIIVPAFIIFALAGCASEGSAPGAASNPGEVPLTKEEMVATHTNTIINWRMGNGDHGQSVYGSDGTVKATAYWSGGSGSDEGTITFEKDNIVCIKWKKWENSCWADYKVGDKIVGHEQGGKKRRSESTVTPKT